MSIFIMGSKEIQGRLWGQRVNDWAEIQEQKGNAGYGFVLNSISFAKDTMLLDVGCGAGYFCKLANDKGAKVVGIDASVELLSVAKRRSPEIKFLVGEIEELPFDDLSFDYVCGFNSFQYAEK
jgi:ubiquinone/menaquinone biosynthesis C-methylase UbiE